MLLKSEFFGQLLVCGGVFTDFQRGIAGTVLIVQIAKLVFFIRGEFLFLYSPKFLTSVIERRVVCRLRSHPFVSVGINYPYLDCRIFLSHCEILLTYSKNFAGFLFSYLNSSDFTLLKVF